MKQSKMAAVREVLSTNPDAKPNDIVAALAEQKIKISDGVASSYKSVIRSAGKRNVKKTSKLAVPKAEPGANGKSHGLDPNLVDLLKIGKSIGWSKVKSLAELMAE
jgi:hypothetical protein